MERERAPGQYNLDWAVCHRTVHTGVLDVSSAAVQTNPLSQQDLLRSAMRALNMTREAFARRFGLSRRALDTYLLPSDSKEYRQLPEVARRYIFEVLWLVVDQRLTYTQCVHILEPPSALRITSMEPQIDPVLVQFAGTRTKDDGAVVRIITDGVPRHLPFHLAVRQHSPLGFEWGYGGSGPKQLALAMCVELVGPQRAERVYQEVVDKLVQPLSQKKDWQLTGSEVWEVIEEAETQLASR